MALEENRPADAENELDRLVHMLETGYVYVEIQNAQMEVQQWIKPQLIDLAATLPAYSRETR